MRYIVVPQPIRLVDPTTLEPGELCPFRKIAMAWLNDPRGGKTPVELLRWLKVIEKFQAAAAGSVIALEDEDYAKLAKIVEVPEAVSFPPVVAVQLLPFMDAILKAPAEDPMGTAAAVQQPAQIPS